MYLYIVFTLQYFFIYRYVGAVISGYFMGGTWRKYLKDKTSKTDLLPKSADHQAALRCNVLFLRYNVQVKHINTIISSITEITYQDKDSSSCNIIFYYLKHRRFIYVIIIYKIGVQKLVLKHD